MGISLTEQTLLYLLNCAVNERTPETLPADVDFEELDRLSRFHSVTAMVSWALDKGGYLTEQYMSKEMIQKWASARINAMRKNIMFDAEREQILRYMEAHGIWYMPLKGVILKEMYPDVGMREMCDNDILFDSTYRKQMRDYMVGRGYDAKEFQKHIADEYLKKPIYNFELHTKLFNENLYGHWAEYYENVKEILCKDDENQYGYHLSKEDFYIYMNVHACKHYESCGTGIRTFLDTFVYLKKEKNRMNWEYIDSKLEVLQVKKYEEFAKEFAARLFDEKKCFADLKTNEDDMLDDFQYILHAGTYGTMHNKIKRELGVQNEEQGKISKLSKMKFGLRRLFPGLDYMKNFYPFLYKHRVLIPFFWMYRLLTAPIVNRKRVFKEIRTLIDLK